MTNHADTVAARRLGVNRSLSAALIEEGLADWQDWQARRARRAGWERTVLERAAQRCDYRSKDEILADAYRVQVARRKAHQIGLAYWPALIESSIDSAAYITAERVLSARYGRYGGERGDSRGGWDSQGHWGVAPWHVARAWLAAGCRNSPKFRATIGALARAQPGHHANYIPRKGDSLPWLKKYWKGLDWLTRRRVQLNLSRKAVAGLGAVSAPLRWAAIKPHLDSPERGLIRPRDLDWAAAAAKGAAIAADPTRKVLAASVGIRAAARVLGVPPTEAAIVAALVAPAYASISLDLARRLALGESPVAISGGHLTRKEAHRWLCDGATANVTTWLAGEYDLPVHRSVAVMRWLQFLAERPQRWAAMETVRVAPGPNGETREFRALDILDEIQEEDIWTGTDSVPAVLERAARRLGDAWMSAQMADHRSLAAPVRWKPPKGARVLTTPAALAREGADMGHCVAGYRDAVGRGECHILAIQTRDGRSTVELSPQLDVVQHKGVGNGEPPHRHQQLVTAWVRAQRRKQK